MKVIAVVSQKGGAGKTTLALHIAVAAERAGLSAAVLDMDPQGTAERWSEWRKEEPPAVVAAIADATVAMTEGWGEAPVQTGIGGSIPFIADLVRTFPEA